MPLLKVDVLWVMWLGGEAIAEAPASARTPEVPIEVRANADDREAGAAGDEAGRGDGEV
ncbi:hypothetical protein [Nannocystis sp. SCPEA4]|uniref:hypothetical protein n=1 Tax=Nannocystis sp. SCPEA4 TaxID=2996787 RepID=UPI002270F2EF|nr:hypothetical protein [Nannocystis sp. SCPEA4]MCY1054990.1 hypothetical protein [Nannocystis sp. SCPEA4]